jgi:hypothetical protein
VLAKSLFHLASTPAGAVGGLDDALRQKLLGIRYRFHLAAIR